MGTEVHRPRLDGLKRVVVVPFLVATLAVAVYAGYQYVVSGAWPWLGPLLVAGGFHLYFGAVVIFRRARTARFPVPILATILSGTAIASYAAYDDLGTEPLVLALGAAVAELLCLVWYSFFVRTP